VDSLVIKVVIEGAAFNNAKKAVRADFSLNGHKYLLKLTDPALKQKYMAGDLGTFNLGKAFLCVSLGEPYKGYAYKLVAAAFLG
jgi:hypothetical protein